MERTLFKIVRILVLVAALLSLLSALVLAGIGLKKHLASAGNDIKPPAISLEEFSQQKDREKAAGEKGAEPASGKEPAVIPAMPGDPNAIPSSFLDVINNIEKSVTSYAAKTMQPAPAPSFRSVLYKRSNVFAQYGFQQLYLTQLDAECKKLDAAGEERAKLAEDDPRRMVWASFLTYYTKAYQDRIVAQVEKNRKAQQEAERENRKATAYFIQAGGSMSVFFITVLLLVLFAIEINTYEMRKQGLHN